MAISSPLGLDWWPGRGGFEPLFSCTGLMGRRKGHFLQDHPRMGDRPKMFIRRQTPFRKSLTLGASGGGSREPLPCFLGFLKEPSGFRKMSSPFCFVCFLLGSPLLSTTQATNLVFFPGVPTPSHEGTPPSPTVGAGGPAGQAPNSGAPQRLRLPNVP